MSPSQSVRGSSCFARRKTAMPYDERERAEDRLQSGRAEHVRRHAAEQSAGRRRDFEDHAETEVDQMTPGGRRRRRDRRGRGDDGHQADGRRGLERHANHEHQERHEEHAAADAEHGAHQTGDHADAKRHRGECRRYEHAGSVNKIGNGE